MASRVFGACVAAAAILSGPAAGSTPRLVPTFSLSANRATINQTVSLRVERAPLRLRQEIRLYLVPRAVARSVRSRFDARLAFIGFVHASKGSRIAFTVPPLTQGPYQIAYWCRPCSLGIADATLLHISGPTSAMCPTTAPNGKRPAGADPFVPKAAYHGNGALAVALATNGTRVVDARGGDKMQWWVGKGVVGHLTVSYKPFGSTEPPLIARTVTDTLYGPDSTMAQITFTTAGCWQITGRINDLSLRFVVQIIFGTGVP